jgi:Peptidase family M1 domain
VTKVIREPGRKSPARGFASALVLSSLLFFSQDTRSSSQSAGTEGAAKAAKPAESLYLQLRSVGLDKSRVYKVRDLAFDRAAFHITLEDGTIAFTEDVAGHVTGAFFEGDGEVLLSPPNQVERASMALFTGAAILEEKFLTAYFRFNDDTFAELQPSLRPTGEGEQFASQWNQTASNLAEVDALRLLVSFSRYLAGTEPSTAVKNQDQLLHARVFGRKLGGFDIYYDSNAREQIWAGQLTRVEGESYYDVWTSFSLIQPTPRTEGSADSSFEPAASDTVSVSDYRIQAEVKPPTQLRVDASLQLEVKAGGQRAILFELSRYLGVEKVESEGQALEFIHNQAVEGTQLARRGNDLLAVVFPRELRSGEKLTLHFKYGGEVLSEAGGGLLYVGARGTWYPNRGLGMSNFDLKFRYPVGWTLVATGKRVDAASENGSTSSGLVQGEQVGHWISERPIPLAGFNLGKYSRAVAHAGAVTVETYASSGVERTFPRGSIENKAPEPPLPPGLRPAPLPMNIVTPSPSPARNAQSVADTSARAIDFFARRFGAYPYSTLALTQMPGQVSQGWPSLIYLSSFSFLTPAERSQLHMSPVTTILSSAVIAHETAHQWWGDLVTWNSYRDQWIVEALANYASLMLLQSRDPQQFRTALEEYRKDLQTKNKKGVLLSEAGPVSLGPRLSCSQFPTGYDAISYGRGTWLFHMLRYMMQDGSRRTGKKGGDLPDDRGDEPFVRALQKLRTRYEGKAISTTEMLRVFEGELPPGIWYEGKKSLSWFYDGWVNGTALPHFELQGVKYADKPGTTIISGTITQRDAPDGLVTPVPLYAVVAGKTVPLGRVFADGPATGFRLSAPAGTRKVVVDPQQTLLTRIR